MLLTSCNKLFYETPMPKQSEIVDQIPDSFLGEFLLIYFGENYVKGQFKTVSKISDRRYLVESADAVFIDSINWADQNMSIIKKVNFGNNYIEIVTNDKAYKKEISDTISSKPKRKEYEIDLKKGFFYDEFYDNELYEESKQICQLRLENGKHYLNIEYFKKYWMISRVSIIGDNLILNSTSFSLQDDRETKFKELKDKYKFEKIKFEQNVKFEWKYYLANSDNDEMEKVLNEDFFDGVVWHRINKKEFNWIAISIGILIFTGITLLLQRTIKRENDREQVI